LFILPLTITENIIFFATLRLRVENLTQSPFWGLSRQGAKVFRIPADFGAKTSSSLRLCGFALKT